MLTHQPSYGQTLLKRILAEIVSGNPRENFRPDWMCGLELDLYYEKHKLAFEFQGDQHFVPVFGSAALERQMINDYRKRQLCRELGIVLVKVEAIELAKFKFKAKVFAALNHYRPIRDRHERKAWLKSILVAPRNKKSLRKQLRDEARSYVANLREKYNSFTAIPRKHTKIRALAKSSFSKINP